MRMTHHILLALLTATLTCSCSLSIDVLGKPIPQKKIARLSPGVTTKMELIDSLGPPLAIAELNEPLTILAPTLMYGIARPRYVYPPSCRAQSAPFFEVFSGTHTFDEFQRVYFFQHYTASRSIFFWLLGAHTSWKTASDNLWVLVNEKNNLVEDYFFVSKGK